MSILGSPTATAAGTPQERATFTEVIRHYVMANEDLTFRIQDFNKKDILFRSHIQERGWPYQALIFDPRVFTALFEKTARILANKPRGRLVPREGGDALGAKINTELLDFEWDDNERVDGMPMLAKWSQMDLNARKYGASFALCKWHWQRQVVRNSDAKVGNVKSTPFFDGPNFKPLNNRDCLSNPAYSTIKNWFQHRDYLTLQELQDINDAARGKPIYKNLDVLQTLMRDQAEVGGDTREINYISQNKVIKGLQDYLGRDQLYKTIEVITEYRNDRWITFAPKHGVILRDIPNPYDHGQIPVVMLRYYPVDDDLYGLSEIEPVEKLQRALNAYICQNLDTLNMSTYTPIKVRQTGGAVQMHTLEFGPGKKWLMNDPATDVMPFESNPQGVTEFIQVYRLMVSAIQEGLGETSAIVSNQEPGASNKTATEIKDLALSRSARDNYNTMFLGEAIKKQMMFWFKMNQQFLFSNPAEQQRLIQITGKDAIKFFQGMGLDGEGLDDTAIEQLSNPDLADIVRPDDLQQPMYPVKVGNAIVPKLQMEQDGQSGKLYLEKEDLAGDYDYIADVGSMSSNANETAIAAKADFMSRVTGVDPKTGQPTGIAAMMAKEGKTIKASDLLVDYAEDIGFKNADQYITNANQGGLVNGQTQDQGQLNGGGAGSVPPGQPSLANGANAGIPGGFPAVSQGQAQPVFP